MLKDEVFLQARLAANQTRAGMMLFFRLLKQLFLNNVTQLLKTTTLSKIKPPHFSMTQFVSLVFLTECITTINIWETGHRLGTQRLTPNWAQWSYMMVLKSTCDTPVLKYKKSNKIPKVHSYLLQKNWCPTLSPATEVLDLALFRGEILCFSGIYLIFYHNKVTISPSVFIKMLLLCLNQK